MRFVTIIVAALYAVGNAPAQTGALDPVFATIPFAQWVENTKPSDPEIFNWSAKVDPGDLSAHQRVQGEIEITVDGADLVKRRGHGALLLLIQITSAGGEVYQDHGTLDLDNVKDGTAKTNIIYTQHIYLIPGEYKATFGVYDKVSGEHAILQRTFRVNGIKNDPLSASWKNLPAVQFAREVKPPDDLLLPYLAPLTLTLNPQRPVDLRLLVNTASTPSVPPATRRLTPLEDVKRRENASPSLRDLGNLMAALRVLSQIEAPSGSLAVSMAVSMIDVQRRKELFDQTLQREGTKEALDLHRVRTALIEADPNTIDLQSIVTRSQNARFFMEQVRKQIAIEPAPEDPLRVVIILSAPLELRDQKDQLSLEGLRGDSRIYHIRYHSPAPRTPAPIGQLGGFGRNQQPFDAAAALEPIDSLVSLLKPLRPRVFDIYSAEDFRKAVAKILAEVEKL